MKTKPNKRIKSTIGRGTESPRYMRINNDMIERSSSYSGRFRVARHAKPSTKAATSAKAKPKPFSVATTKPRSGPKPGTGYKTNYGL
jgi:hypothetical protein